jgi:hypothetical protein
MGIKIYIREGRNVATCEERPGADSKAAPRVTPCIVAMRPIGSTL